MAAQEVKNQHFVPRTYLKHFSERRGDNYYISALPKAEPLVGNISERNTKKICFERHLYTLPGETTEERMLIENFYGDQFERHYNDMYDILVNPAKVTLSDEERKLIIGTVVTMLYRVPLWIKRHNEHIKRLYENAFAEYERTGKHEFEIDGKKVSLKDKSIVQIIEEHQASIKPQQVVAQLQTAMELLKVRLENDNIFISKLVDDDSHLIISDNPVVIQNIDGSDRPVDPFDPTNIIKLPLDNDHILMLMPTGPKEDRHIIRRNIASGVHGKREAVISNSEQFNGADLYLLGDESSLIEYLSTKELAEGPIHLDDNGQITEDFLRKAREAGLLF